jgi:hypothetical protein
MVADGAGGAIVAWQDSRTGNTYTDADIYAQHLLASGVADPAWPTDGRALCTAADNQGNALVVTDGAGGAIVTWYDGRDGTTDLYAQHVLASGAVDPAWPSDGGAVCTAGFRQFFPFVVAADGSGGVLVAWGDNRGAGGYADIYAQHMLATGIVDPAWPTVGRGVCTAASDQSFPAMIADGAGGAVIAWVDGRGCSDDIYAHHLLASGLVDSDWPAAGRALCTAPSYQRYPTMVADGTGGAMVAWQDERDGNADIYSHHLSGDIVTPVLLSLLGAEANAEGVRLAWLMTAGSAISASIYRRTPDSGWLELASVHPDGSGRIAYVDRAVEPGRRYGYRVGLPGRTGESYLGETWITVPGTPALAFAVLRPNPADRDVTVAFSLPTAEPSAVEWVDLSGRIVARHELEAKPGSFVVTLGDSRRLAPGFYFVRLVQSGRSVARKVCVVH